MSALDGGRDDAVDPAGDPAGEVVAEVGGPERVRALRGATTLDEDSRDQVITRTQELIAEVFTRNELTQDDVVSIVFTATDDIHAAFPAEAAREAGIVLVPLLCARELDIEGATPLAVRVLLHVYTRRRPDELRHVYLHGASQLRTDLPE